MSIRSRSRLPFIALTVVLALRLTSTAASAEPSNRNALEAPSTSTAIAVSNCNASGPGSLREAVASAASGDTIIVKPHGCNDIRLNGGAIPIGQHDLTLIGPGPDALLVSGNRASPVFSHSGIGTLRISGMSIGYGRLRGGNVFGGCIFSGGNLKLKAVRVHHCVAQGVGDVLPEARGGGIYAADDVVLVDTVVRANLADAQGIARAGGLYAGGRLTMIRSQIRNNVASGGGVGGPGGAYVLGSLHAYYSEISGNQADYIGGVAAYGEVVLAHSSILNNQATVRGGGGVLGGENVQILIVDSTISGNSATTLGGVSLTGFNSSNTLANSTIAFNRERTTDSGACEGGLNLRTQLHIESSIVARNSCNGRPLDIVAIEGPTSITGADNLVEFSTAPLPPDTLSVNPGLKPLAANGGPTRTHALQPESPAIDRGNNVTGLDFDQRGQGFARVNGPRADIGAYESLASP